MSPVDEPIASRTRLDAFVGRAGDLAAIRAHFDGGGRALSLVGPPGVGKTRLACEYAAAQAARGLDEAVHFCDLTTARDRDEVCIAVARALSLASASSVEQVGAAIAARGDALLVLDNFEQAIAAAPETVQRWLVLCPSVRLLVTSREVLRVPGETVYELGPLDTRGGAAAASSEAAALLFARVSAARVGWTPTPAERADVGEIARRLDGLPLAIELAAARVVMLGAAAVLARLDRRLDLLTHGARGLSARQGTLRGSLDASWEMLSAAEQDAAARCSIFRGGFTLDAVEALLAPRVDPPAASLVQSLREKSLLRDEGSDPRGARRFGMYLCVQEYLALHVDDPRDLGRRHAEHYAALGEREAARLDGHGGPEALACLYVERENLVAAATFALATGEADLALRALVALDRAHPPSDAHLGLLDAALRLADAAGTPRAGTLLLARADALRRRGRVEQSERDLARALDLARAADDRELVAACLVCRGALLGNLGRYDDAKETVERLLADEGVGRYRRKAHASLGVTCFELGRPADADMHLRRARELCREAGDAWQEATVLGNLGVLHLNYGRFDEARVAFDAALALVPGPAVSWIWALLRCQLGTLHATRGDLDAAHACFAEGTRALRQAGNTRAAAAFSVYLGAVQLLRGDLSDALATLRQSLAGVARVDNGTYSAFGTALLAAALAAAGQLADADEAADAAASMVARAVEPPPFLVIAVEALGAAVLYARAAEERAAGEAAALRAEARRRRLAVAAAIADGAVARLDPSIALQVVDSAQPPEVPEALADAHDGALEVDRGRAFVRLPDGRAVLFARRRTLWLLLLALAERRRARPGEAVTHEELRAAAWPGERMSAAVARNRLHVSLSTLRSLGLRDLLLSRGEGYALDPRVPLRVVGAA